MSKQDKVAPRTPADLERKYGKNFSEILGVATDARDYAKEAKKETEEIKLQIGKGINAQFKLTIEEDDTKTFSLIDGSATKIHFKSDSLLIESTNFTLQEDGTVKIKKGDIGGCSVNEGKLVVPVEFLSGKILATQINADGIVAKNVDLSGKITATSGSFGSVNITASGNIFGIPYEGIYMGSAANDIFLGNLYNYTGTTAYSNGYRAVLGLGVQNGGVLLTNKSIEFGASSSIAWTDIRTTVIRMDLLYKNHPELFM